MFLLIYTYQESIARHFHENGFAPPRIPRNYSRPQLRQVTNKGFLRSSAFPYVG